MSSDRVHTLDTLPLEWLVARRACFRSAQTLEHVLALGDLSENRVLFVERFETAEAHEELRARGIR